MVSSICQNGGVNFEAFPEIATYGDPPAWGLLFWTPAWELTLRRPNFLAKKVKVGSDHSTSVFYGAKNEKFSFKTIYY